MNYEMNTQAARTVGTSNYLKTSGKYIGSLTRAEYITSKQGTIGIEFSFRTREGQEAEYLQIWTRKSDGTAIDQGIAMVSAIMACVRLRGIKVTDGFVEKKNRETHQKERVAAKIYPDLVGKEIGLVLQEEEYEKDDLSTGSSLKIIAPFEASSELTAGEILDRKTTPEALAGIVMNLMKNPVKKAKPRAGTQQQYAQAQHTMQSGAAANLDDDIPF